VLGLRSCVNTYFLLLGDLCGFFSVHNMFFSAWFEKLCKFVLLWQQTIMSMAVEYKNIAIVLQESYNGA
jgi:hypothetical protein